MNQKEIWLHGEGDAWLDRNRDKLGIADPVSEVIEKHNIRPKSVLEIGCSNGWRLARLRERFGCEIMGVEPSMKAGLEAAALRVPVMQSTATTLPFAQHTFDLVIYGFCLYLTEPEDWLRAAAEGDSVLKPGGYLIIHDFNARPPWFARKYKHRDGVLSYHFDFSRLWHRGTPMYVMIYQKEFGVEMVTVLQKSDRRTGFMENRE